MEVPIKIFLSFSALIKKKIIPITINTVMNKEVWIPTASMQYQKPAIPVGSPSTAPQYFCPDNIFLTTSVEFGTYNFEVEDSFLSESYSNPSMLNPIPIVKTGELTNYFEINEGSYGSYYSLKGETYFFTEPSNYEGGKKYVLVLGPSGFYSPMEE